MVVEKEEEEDEESETKTEIEIEGLWWKKCEPFGEAWSFSTSAVRMLNEASEGLNTKAVIIVVKNFKKNYVSSIYFRCII